MPEDTCEEVTRPAGFAAYVASAAARGELVVQPRMGFSDPAQMRDGLVAVRDCQATTVGTITVDSYTRLGRVSTARAAMADGTELNGFPITVYDRRQVEGVVQGIQGPGFPVQVRHGSPQPQRIIDRMLRLGLDATEGGPVSYCLPYGRYPLRRSLENWRIACDLLAEAGSAGLSPHLETFGGCLLGQMCPSGLLVAVSVLEGLFFRQRGVTSISFSYAQQTNQQQDEQALRALRRLAAELLPADTDWHIVLYTYMGLYPRTRIGALRLLAESAELAVRSGAARLVVKSAAEAHRIPTVAENVEALETATVAARRAERAEQPPPWTDNAVYTQARTLVDAVLNLDGDVGEALVRAFEQGRLDIPYCLHSDNAGRTRSYIDSSGWLRWAEVGLMPIAPDGGGHVRLTSGELVAGLSFVRDRYDDLDPAATMEEQWKK